MGKHACELIVNWFEGLQATAHAMDKKVVL